MNVSFADYEIKIIDTIPVPYGEGIIVYADGSTYSGQFLDPQQSKGYEPVKHGQGINILEDGSFYTGDLVGGEADGQGLFYFVD